MTTNGRDSNFKNRVKKMLADKIAGDPKSFAKNNKKLIYNYHFGKTTAGVLEPEEIIVTDDAVSSVEKNGHVLKAGKKVKLAKKKGEVDSENFVRQLHDESVETITSKENVREKRRRIETAKNRRRDLSLKKQKTNNLKGKRFERKISGPINPSILIDELNYDDENDDDLSSENDNERKGKLTGFLEKRRKFGEPTIIEGTPKSVSKFPLHSSPVLNLNSTSLFSNSHRNILSNFCTDDENPSLAIFRNAIMNDKKIDAYMSEDTDDLGENETKVLHENVKSSNCDSDISFISSDGTVDSNFFPNRPSHEFATKTVREDAVESENDSKEKPEFYTLQNKVVAIMGPSCKFYFNGKLRVKVLIGKVEIYGFVFGKCETVLPTEIYSPRGSSLVSIETVHHHEYADKNITPESLYSLLTNEGINKGVATELQSKLDELPDGQAVLIFENLENTLTKFLDCYYPFKLFPKTDDPTNYHNRHPKKAEKLLQAIIHYDDDLGKQLKKDDYRKSKILSKILNPLNGNDSQRILIAGGKGVGKSTTLRYFANGLLPNRGEIVVVDFDPGQPEFTPPGCISLNIIDRPLTGPNYTHLKTPFYQLFIGDVDVARCVPRYVKAARKLVDYLNESPRLRGRTVLINTMGFCSGIGWDLTVYIIKLIHPSTVVQITSERSKNNFRYLLSSEVVDDQSPTHFTGGESENSVWEAPCDHELYVVPSLAEGKGKFGDFWEMEPRQQRDITLLAYLSKILKDHEEVDNFLFSSLPRINDTIPYSIPMSKLMISLTRTIVPASHILATMNGNIVALCGVDVADETSDSEIIGADLYPKALLRAPLSTCYGFGIVRGVDMESGTIFVNTPLCLSELKHVNSLVGSIPLPTILISSDRRNAPYIGEGADLPTSREPRRGYFRMRQRNNNN